MDGLQMIMRLCIFQSTLPIQGETVDNVVSLKRLIFQSTLPIQGETLGKPEGTVRRWNFNPLSLYRERQTHLPQDLRRKLFQSTLPIQGETGQDR